MLIDLRTKKHPEGEHVSPAKDQRELIRSKLSRMTVRQLRQFARDRHISLGGASMKYELITEIMGQYGHQWGPKHG